MKILCRRALQGSVVRCVAGDNDNVYILVLLGLVDTCVNFMNLLSFCCLRSIMPMVCACFRFECLILLPACSITRCLTLAVKAVLLSARMVSGTYTCVVKIDIRPFTTDGSSGRLNGIANMYGERTSTAMRLCVEPLKGGSVPTKSVSMWSSGSLFGS